MGLFQHYRAPPGTLSGRSVLLVPERGAVDVILHNNVSFEVLQEVSQVLFRPEFADEPGSSYNKIFLGDHRFMLARKARIDIVETIKGVGEDAYDLFFRP